MWKKKIINCTLYIQPKGYQCQYCMSCIYLIGLPLGCHGATVTFYIGWDLDSPTSILGSFKKQGDYNAVSFVNKLQRICFANQNETYWLGAKRSIQQATAVVSCKRRRHVSCKAPPLCSSTYCANSKQTCSRPARSIAGSQLLDEVSTLRCRERTFARIALLEPSAPATQGNSQLVPESPRFYFVWNHYGLTSWWYVLMSVKPAARSELSSSPDSITSKRSFRFLPASRKMFPHCFI